MSKFQILRVLVAAYATIATGAVCAQSRDISSWKQTGATHPAGTVYTAGEAVMARYPMAALNAANGGGLSAVPKNNPQARMEWALAIIEMGMSDFEMTTLSGMPAAIGAAETYDGERSFAASFSGRVGSDREMLSIFYAPKPTFEQLGGMDMLAQNRPRVGVNYAVDSKPSSAPTRNQASVKKPAPAAAAKPEPAASQKKPRTGGMSEGAAALLAGVRGDMAKLEEKHAEERAVRKAREEREKTAALQAQREALYRASGARKGNYPAPSKKGEMLVWPEEGPWRVQVQGDKASPRVATREYGGAQATPRAALKTFTTETGLNRRDKAKFEPLESYQKLDGRDFQIMLTETRMHGQTAIAFVMFAQSKGKDTASLRVLEMPAKTYIKWGGVAGMMTLRGVVPSPEVFPKAERDRIARSPLPEQTALYEAVLDKYYMENALALMATQAKTLEMMTELNYDLLFGNDITPGPWAD